MSSPPTGRPGVVRGKSARISERSPLIIPRRSAYDNSDVESTKLSISTSQSPTFSRRRDYDDDADFEKSKSTLYLILLTLSIGGLQIVWSIELSNGSPYLLSLGMSKALVAFVWLAGPMTGVLVQPYVGMVSDRCQISWGKRKPFMLAGTLGVVVTSLLLAYARQIIQVIGRYDWDAPYDGNWKFYTIVMATVLMWCLDFSINTGMTEILGPRHTTLTHFSTSVNSGIHRGWSSFTSTRSSKCLGISHCWHWQCLRICCWLSGSATHLLVLGEGAIPGSLRLCFDCPHYTCLDQCLYCQGA